MSTSLYASAVPLQGHASTTDLGPSCKLLKNAGFMQERAFIRYDAKLLLYPLFNSSSNTQASIAPGSSGSEIRKPWPKRHSRPFICSSW